MTVSSIPFIQFMRPNGRQVEVQINRPNHIAVKAQQIIAKGYRFECEQLTTGEVSLTITDPKEGDLAIKIVLNGPEVPAAVDALIEEFQL